MKTRFLILPCMLALLLAAPVYAQAPYADSATTANEQAPSEGIAVSGAWILSVYEPDGTLVEERSFHNALVSTGADVLVSLATASRSAGYWIVEVLGIGGPCAVDTFNASCQMFPDTIPETETNQFANLVISSIDQDDDGLDDTIALNGSITIAHDGNIQLVFTTLATCPSNVSPDDCIGNQFLRFTEKILDSALVVDAGQVVQVEVLIGFSSATSAAARTTPTERRLN